MKNDTNKQSVARIFEDIGGYFISDNSLSYLDARGSAFPSRRAAIASLKQARKYIPEGYTHYLSKGRKVKL
jgi:hypothetical protein